MTNHEIAVKLTAEIVADTVAFMAKQAGVSYEEMVMVIFVDKEPAPRLRFNNLIQSGADYIKKHSA